MGLSIFYSGHLHSMQQLPDLMIEVRDICDHMHWSHDLYTPTKSIPLQGMWMAPPDCDQLWLTFTSTGEWASPGRYLLNGRHSSGHRSTAVHDTISTMTQFAGPDVHIQLIGLLGYLQGKYFSEFDLLDESEYWETGNADRCRHWFEMFDTWMDQTSARMGSIESQRIDPGHIIYAQAADLARQGRLKEWILFDTLHFIPPFRKG